MSVRTLLWKNSLANSLVNCPECVARERKAVIEREAAEGSQEGLQKLIEQIEIPMKFDPVTKHYICKRCGLYATREQVGDIREKLEELQKSLAQFSTEVLVCPCDVSDKESVKKMSGAVLEKFGKIDILVNNAGFAIYGTVANLTIEEIESQMQTNYFGMVYCTKNFLSILQKQNSGHIVNVASVAASFGLPGIAPYCASKFAMLGFSEGLKHELKDTKIGVTVVSPIMVRTNFFDHESFAKMPKYSPTSLDPKTVANAIIRASESSRLEIIVPGIVRIGVWLKHTIPFVINPIMGAAFRKLQK